MQQYWNTGSINIFAALERILCLLKHIVTLFWLFKNKLKSGLSLLYLAKKKENGVIICLALTVLLDQMGLQKSDLLF